MMARLGNCPHCRSPLALGQSICHYCGRMTQTSGPGNRGSSPGVRVRKGGQLARPAPEPKPRQKRGKRRKSTTRRAVSAHVKRRRNKNARNAAIAIVLAGIFLFTPAQDTVKEQSSKLFGDVVDLLVPFHEHPVSANFTLEHKLSFEAIPTGSGAIFIYRMPIPDHERTAKSFDSALFMDSATGTPIPAPVIQRVTAMRVGVGSADTEVPVTTVVVKDMDDAVVLADGWSRVWWPEAKTEHAAPNTIESPRTESLWENRQYDCEYGRCMIWEGVIPPAGGRTTLTIEYDIEAIAYTWDGEAPLDLKVAGMTNGYGISSANAGSFDELHTGGITSLTEHFGDSKTWYDTSTGGISNAAIDGQDPLVLQIADEIIASMPAAETNNTYSYSHASFVWVRDNVEYVTGLTPPRNGPTCLTQKNGDCDEQSNAWMSLLRVHGIPTWYEFGILGAGDFSTFEPHAWSNIALPYSGEWCTENGFTTDSCYIEASVDVTNNKWLLHTPTAYTNWIEPIVDNEGGLLVKTMYYRLYYDSRQMSDVSTKEFDVLGSSDIPDGTFRVNWIPGR